MAISLDLVQKIPLFSSLNAQYQEKISERAELVEYDRGQFIFAPGEHLKVVQFLAKGKVTLTDTEGSEQVLTPVSERAQQPLSDSSFAMSQARAKTKVILVELERDFLDLMLAWDETSEYSLTALKDQTIEVAEDHEMENDWMASLLNSPLIAAVPPSNIQSLLTKFEAQEVSAGEVVIKEGTRGEYFYVIDTGSFEVLSKTAHLDVILKTGQFFGEEALVADSVRNASVVAQTDGVLMRLNKDDFKALLQGPLLREADLGQLETATVIDVRLPMEHKQHRAPHSLNVPLPKLRQRLDVFAPGVPYFITDDGGRRSEVAVHLLCQVGIDAYLLKDAETLYSNP